MMSKTIVFFIFLTIFEFGYALPVTPDSMMLYQIDTGVDTLTKQDQIISDQIEFVFDVPNESTVKNQVIDDIAQKLISESRRFNRTPTGKTKKPFQYSLPNSQTEIVIPYSTYDQKLLHEFLKLNPQQQLAFLDFKQDKLKKLAQFLDSKLKMSPEKINSTLIELNQELFISYKIVAARNTIGTHKMVSLAIGSALPQKIRDYLVEKFTWMQKIQNNRMLKWIPENGGFFYAVGFGFGLYKQTNPQTKKSRYVIDFYSDFERLKSTITGVLEVSANLTYGMTLEYRAQNENQTDRLMQIDRFMKPQQMENTYGGILGVMRKGETHFGWNLLTAISFPPILGNLFLYTNQSQRLHLLALSFPATVVDPLVDLITSGMKITKKLFSPLIYFSEVKDQQISGRTRLEPKLIYQLELDLDRYPSLRNAVCERVFN